MPAKPLKMRQHCFSVLEHIDPLLPYDHHNIPFSLLLPMINVLIEYGERLFIDIFREILPLINNEETISQIKTFIFQEANHTKMYQAYTSKLKDLNNPSIDYLFQASDAHFKSMRQELAERKSLKDRLHFVIMSELFASGFFYFFLEKYMHRIDDFNPIKSYLYMLHGIEEIEHRSLAFDIFHELYGIYSNQVSHFRDEFAAYSKHMIKSLLSWLIAASDDWNKTKPNQVLDKIQVADMLIGTNGVFPNGDICKPYFQSGFHPAYMGDDSFVQQWDNYTERQLIDLIARKNKN